ncbi:MAG: alpha-1,2-fucosyltransferase, partial [Betaproteobacteria bacterium]|nr:alpha-1,2-fucosyltransferase [Betaproteobacteria bacterium]
MICIHLKGGLGNQMFQYAAGRALADHIKTDLYLDLTTYQTDKIRKFELLDFNIRAEIADENILKGWPIKYKKINKIFQKLGLRSKYHFELSYNFDPNYFNLKVPVMLDGFYQSEKYFLKYKESIFNDFTLIDPLDPENLNTLNKIKRSESVMIHVRRGDYVNNPINLQIHGICDIDYYKKGIELILNKIKNPSFFVFSDDINWCKSNFRYLNNVSYIENNENEPSKDIYLMSHCKHFIIANSSFSWWGAWLGNSYTKLVISPKKWFVDLHPIFSFMLNLVKFIYVKENGLEEAIYRGTDYWVFEGSRSWHSCKRA